MHEKRGQAATEYLILSGFIFVVITVGVALLYNYGTESMGDVATAQMKKICHDIASTAESVYYMGEPARRTIDANFPKGVKSMEIEMNDPASNCTDCTEIRFFVQKGRLLDQIICSTNVNITILEIGNKSITPGLKRIRIDAIGNRVLLNMSA